jgi:hypothetical protein
VGRLSAPLGVPTPKEQALALTKKEQARLTVVIHELANLSRDGWRNAKRVDWEPLERELQALLEKKHKGASNG